MEFDEDFKNFIFTETIFDPINDEVRHRSSSHDWTQPPVWCANLQNKLNASVTALRGHRYHAANGNGWENIWHFCKTVHIPFSIVYSYGNQITFDASLGALIAPVHFVGSFHSVCSIHSTMRGREGGRERRAKSERIDSLRFLLFMAIVSSYPGRLFTLFYCSLAFKRYQNSGV